jgi:hypothetical protein
MGLTIISNSLGQSANSIEGSTRSKSLFQRFTMSPKDVVLENASTILDDISLWAALVSLTITSFIPTTIVRPHIGYESVWSAIVNEPQYFIMAFLIGPILMPSHMGLYLVLSAR